ncbi:MAG: sigma-70 family RNA polymerase sigma factor [Planctomycetes bacterium]|nr:sigma-70 family RNA polymerase sigma factor [Planctomycetota bacterium]
MNTAIYPQDTLLEEAQAFVDRIGAPSPGAQDPALALEEVGGLDTALMQIFTATGDSQAFEFLYKLTSEPLLSWIRGRARQVARRLDVREILQDTFINIYRYANSFKGEGIHGFRRWARTIAANAMHRASRRRTLVFSEWTEGVMQVASPGGGPRGLVEAREFAVEVEGAYQLLLRVAPIAFAELSPRDQFVLHAVDQRGVCYRDVEQELGLRSGALKMIVHRARIRLRTHFNRLLHCK